MVQDDALLQLEQIPFSGSISWYSVDIHIIQGGGTHSKDGDLKQRIAAHWASHTASTPVQSMLRIDGSVDVPFQASVPTRLASSDEVSIGSASATGAARTEMMCKERRAANGTKRVKCMIARYLGINV